MEPAHLHLLTNHIPVIGSIIGIFVLLYGLIAQSEHTKNVAYFIFIFCAIGASITFGTGEAAEETIERIGGFSETVVEKHEDSAMGALVSILILGGVSITALLLAFFKSRVTKSFTYLILVVALIAFGFTAYTANLGGQIRHTEIFKTPSQPTTYDQGDDD